MFCVYNDVVDFMIFFCKFDLFIVQVEEQFVVERNGINVETRLVNDYLDKVFKGFSFYILNIIYMSEFRVDVYLFKVGGKKYDDCMYWCLFGIIDIWNDLFVVILDNIKDYN